MPCTSLSLHPRLSSTSVIFDWEVDPARLCSTAVWALLEVKLTEFVECLYFKTEAKKVHFASCIGHHLDRFSAIFFSCILLYFRMTRSALFWIVVSLQHCKVYTDFIVNWVELAKFNLILHTINWQLTLSWLFASLFDIISAFHVEKKMQCSKNLFNSHFAKSLSEEEISHCIKLRRI